MPVGRGQGDTQHNCSCHSGQIRWPPVPWLWSRLGRPGSLATVIAASRSDCLLVQDIKQVAAPSRFLWGLLSPVPLAIYWVLLSMLIGSSRLQASLAPRPGACETPGNSCVVIPHVLRFPTSLLLSFSPVIIVYSVTPSGLGVFKGQDQGKVHLLYCGTEPAAQISFKKLVHTSQDITSHLYEVFGLCAEIPMQTHCI